MRMLTKLAAAGLTVFALLQLVRPGIPPGPTGAELQAPPRVRQILERDCYSCHSNQRRLAWFDQIVLATGWCATTFSRPGSTSISQPWDRSLLPRKKLRYSRQST